MLLMVDDPAVHFPIEHHVRLVFDVGDLPDVAAGVPTDADVVVDHCSLQQEGLSHPRQRSVEDTHLGTSRVRVVDGAGKARVGLVAI